METLEILEIIQKGESSKVQFKERLKDAHSISQEMAAFANLKGGTILIGVDDKTGELNGLSFTEIQKYNEILVNAASNNIKPSIFIETEQIIIDKQIIIIVNVPEGNNKPYKDKNGIIWIKNGADKRRVTSNEELVRLLQSSRSIFADEQIVPNSTFADFNVDKFEQYVQKRYKKTIQELGTDIRQLANNINLYKGKELTLTGLLLFGKNPQKYRPMFSIQCVAFSDNNVGAVNFEDKEPTVQGDLKTIFDTAISFVKRNIHKTQIDKSFNSVSEPEIPYEVFEEIIVNSLIHRDYYINSTVKLFIFPDRIEIISPGVLPNSLTVENILNGISISRNPTLQSVAQFILPYSGLGTGLIRIMNIYPDIEFKNIVSSEQFKVIIKRK